jgi:chromate transporter
MSTHPPPSIAQLFTSFLRLGVTAFGGPSMIVYIRTMAVEKKHWLDARTFGDGVALCQMIPGATAMQTAAFVGLRARGVLGAGASFVGFGLPAFLLMLVLATLYTRTHDLPVILSAFSGLQAIIVAIVANATLSFGYTTLKNWQAVAMAGLAALLFGFHVNPIYVVLFAALAGWVIMKPQPSASGQLGSRKAARPKAAHPYARPLLLILSVAGSSLLVLFLLDRTLFDLAVLMFRIDLLAFGGGFASVPLMLHEVVQVRHWIDSETFMNGIVLGQVTPGPIVITATFVGYLVGGLLSGVVATISIFLPSFIVLVGVWPYFDRLRMSLSFHKVIRGVLCSFVGLLLTVTIRFAWDVPWDISRALLAASALVALLLKVDILWVVLGGAVLSVLSI